MASVTVNLADLLVAKSDVVELVAFPVAHCGFSGSIGQGRFGSSRSCMDLWPSGYGACDIGIGEVLETANLVAWWIWGN